jgi:hypothetical protein
MKLKLCIIGHKRHGKDTVAEYFKKYYRYNYESSSMAAAKIFIYDKLKDEYNYKSVEDCFNDRMNHRPLWYNMICDYNKNDKTRLAKDIMLENEIYVGMRDYSEIKECRKENVFNSVISVYNYRLPLEDENSFNIDIFRDSDFIINNNGTLLDLSMKVLSLNKIFGDKVLDKVIDYYYSLDDYEVDKCLIDFGLNECLNTTLNRKVDCLIEFENELIKKIVN